MIGEVWRVFERTKPDRWPALQDPAENKWVPVGKVYDKARVARSLATTYNNQRPNGKMQYKAFKGSVVWQEDTK
jgi:hypothetical protein